MDPPARCISQPEAVLEAASGQILVTPKALAHREKAASFDAALSSGGETVLMGGFVPRP